MPQNKEQSIKRPMEARSILKSCDGTLKTHSDEKKIWLNSVGRPLNLVDCRTKLEIFCKHLPPARNNFISWITVGLSAEMTETKFSLDSPKKKNVQIVLPSGAFSSKISNNNAKIDEHFFRRMCRHLKNAE